MIGITLICFLLEFISISHCQVPHYGQCGGISYKGSTQCATGFTCFRQNSYYSQCLISCPSGWECVSSATTIRPNYSIVPEFGQCGGSSWTGGTICGCGLVCHKQNSFYSQCLKNCPTGWDCTASQVSNSYLIPQYGQCGGISWSSRNVCEPCFTCYRQNAFYSQCLSSCPAGWECVDPKTIPSTHGSTLTTTQDSTSTRFSTRPSSIRTSITSTTSRRLTTTLNVASTRTPATLTTTSVNRLFSTKITPSNLNNESCYFKFGTMFVGNYDYSQVDFIGMLLGTHSTEHEFNFNPHTHGLMLQAVLKYNKIPLFYTYIIRSMSCYSNTFACTKGANVIRNRRHEILATYLNYATETAKYMGTRVPSIWLIEPDFWQYYGDSSQQNGALTGAQMRSLFDDIATTIKSQVPNAIISWDISAWIGEAGMRQWWSFFATSTHIDFIHTSGGRSQANSIEIKQNELKWSFMSTLTGKKIIADTGFINTHDYSWDASGYLKARIDDGVIAVVQRNALDNWNLDKIRSYILGVSQTKLC